MTVSIAQPEGSNKVKNAGHGEDHSPFTKYGFFATYEFPAAPDHETSLIDGSHGEVPHEETQLFTDLQWACSG